MLNIYIFVLFLIMYLSGLLKDYKYFLEIKKMFWKKNICIISIIITILKKCFFHCWDIYLSILILFMYYLSVLLKGNKYLLG